MNKRFIFIVGLQKSGTTLLLRMLSHCKQVENPFKSEGNDFWGNIPPFTPVEFPAGYIYQREKGKMGHEINAEDATEEIIKELNDRLKKLSIKSDIVLNKNPYNTVRLPWLKKLFPDSVIVAMVRRPVPNVFSLLKKYVIHENNGLAPENGWWGVKPRGWHELVQENKIIQCSMQWDAINKKLWQDRGYLDMILSYHDLCTFPARTMNKILSIALGREFKTDLALPPIKCFDLEYKRGSQLLSKNKYYSKFGDLKTPDEESIEIEPLRNEDIELIEKICGSTTNTIEGL